MVPLRLGIDNLNPIYIDGFLNVSRISLSWQNAETIQVSTVYGNHWRAAKGFTILLCCSRFVLVLFGSTHNTGRCAYHTRQQLF